MNLIPHFIEFNDKNEPNKTVWKYKSDFALLHLPECSFTQELAKPIIDVSHLDCDNLPIIGESVFLFGIASFDYEGVEEENEIAKFKAKKLNVSNGRVTKVSETICEHNAEVVKGMDGVLCLMLEVEIWCRLAYTLEELMIFLHKIT